LANLSACGHAAGISGHRYHGCKSASFFDKQPSMEVSIAMKTRGYVHRFVTSLVLMSAAAIALKGFLMPENTALLLRDTGIAPPMYTDVLSFALPLALTICALLALIKLTSIAPIVICLGIYAALSGIALYQGLHFDCGCYMPGSTESLVYSELEPLFLIQALITTIAGALYLFNIQTSISNTVHTA